MMMNLKLQTKMQTKKYGDIPSSLQLGYRCSNFFFQFLKFHVAKYTDKEWYFQFKSTVVKSPS